MQAMDEFFALGLMSVIRRTLWLIRHAKADNPMLGRPTPNASSPRAGWRTCNASRLIWRVIAQRRPSGFG